MQQFLCGQPNPLMRFEYILQSKDTKGSREEILAFEAKDHFAAAQTLLFYLQLFSEREILSVTRRRQESPLSSR